MTEATDGAPGLPGGLCVTCAHVRVVRSGRGSIFLMCQRGLRREAGFAKYPRLPVLRCTGHVHTDEASQND